MSVEEPSASLTRRARDQARQRLTESWNAVRVTVALARRVRADPSLWARARRVLRWQLLAVLVVFVAASPAVLRATSLVAEHDVPRRAYDDGRVRVFGVTDDARGIHVHVGDKKPRPASVVSYPGAALLSTRAPWLVSAWLALLALYGAWITIETIVGALSRDYSDAVADDLSRAMGLDVAPPTGPPRIRINWKRLWRKVVSEIGALLVLASGAPFFLIGRSIPRIGEYAYAGAFGAWGTYWLLVSTAAKADRTWKMENAPTPWFLRLWDRLTALTPRPLRWLPRTYGRLWARVTRSMNGAAALTEAAPMYVAGLVVVRLATKIPILSFAARPLLPVAADLAPGRSAEMGRAEPA